MSPAIRIRPHVIRRGDDVQAARRRERLLLDVLPYGMLAFCVLVSYSLRTTNDAALLAGLIISAVTAAWMLWMFTLHPAWRQRPRMMAVFVTGLILLGALLILDNTLFGLFTFTIYFYAILFLAWPWRLLGAAAVGLLAATAQAYGVDKDTAAGLLIYLIIVAVNVAIALAYAWSRWHTECAVGQLSATNHRLEATLAENAGLQQQLLTQAREAGVVEERQRMAREIHDTLAQGLTGIITQLQAAEQAADDPAGWRRHFEAATGLARESLSEARRSVEALRPERLETGRLSEALADVATRWSARHGIAAQVTTTGTARPMPPQAEFALLRTAQEALTNVARHAAATRVGVTLSYMEHEVALDVRDDGCGFDPALLDPAAPGVRPPDDHRMARHAVGSTIGLVGLTVGDGLRPTSHAGPTVHQGPASRPGADHQGGFGLVAMRQRIESLAGTLQVESEPGFGTGISACLPVAQAAP